MTFFMYNKNRNFKVVWNNIYEKYNIIFILGQIGMIYLYYNEYYKNKSTFINIINLITFSLLTIFYFSKVITNHIKNKENNLMQLGLILVGLLYLINIINLYYDIKNIKNKNKE